MQNGIMNNDVVSFEDVKIKFLKGEKVVITEVGKFGNYNIASEDGKKTSWAGDFEVTLMKQINRDATIGRINRR